MNKVLSCEVLSINCSYSKEGKYPSHNLISKEQRPKSKLVINSSRGEVVDYSEIAKRNPRKRVGTPEDMAGLAIFLCSRAGAYTVGETITSDGGIVKTANHDLS